MAAAADAAVVVVVAVVGDGASRRNAGDTRPPPNADGPVPVGDVAVAAAGIRSTSARADADETSPEEVVGREADPAALCKNDRTPPSVSASLQSSRTVSRRD